MDRSEGMGELMQLPNQYSIYSYLYLSVYCGGILGHIQYAPTRIHDHFSQKDETPTKTARFTFYFSIIDHTYRRDMHTIYAGQPFTSFNL